jgi:hypothetical protein
MADKKIKVKVDIDVDAEPSIAQLKALKKELKNTAAGSDEFKKLYNQIDDLEDKIKGTKAASADWIDSLESAGGPLGTLGAGLNKLKQSTVSFSAALKATGIGLVVAAIGGLVAAFSQTDGAMKKLQPLMIAFQKILGGIFEAIQPLLDAFIEMATKALPYITTGVKVFYASLVSLFTLVKEGGAGIGKILKGIFTLDKKSIEEGYEQLKGTWAKTTEAFDKATDNFDKGYAKRTKIEKENGDKALQERLKRLDAEDKLDQAQLEKLKEQELALAKTEQDKLDIEEAFAKKEYELRSKELDARLKLYKKDSAEYKTILADKTKLDADYLKSTSDFADRQKKITEDSIKSKKDEALALATTEQEKIDIEQKYAKELYDFRKGELEKSLKNAPSVEAAKSINNALAKLDEDRLAELGAFGVRQNKITEDTLKAQREFASKVAQIKAAAVDDEVAKAKASREEKYNKDLADLEADKEFIKQSEEEKADIRKNLRIGYINDLATIEKDAKVKAMQDDLDLLSAQQKTLTEGTQAFLDNSIAIENEAYQIKLLNAKDNAKKIQTIETEHEQNIKDIKLKALLAEKQIQLERIAMIASIGSSISALAGKNKALAIAGITIEKAAAIGQIWVNNSIANAKAVAASPLTFGMPWVAVNTAAAVLGTAAAIASGVKAIQEINAVQTPGVSSSGGGGGIGSTAAPTPPTVGSAAAPQIQTSGGQNPNTAIADTISKAQAPIKAYVVSGEVSSQQALDRRTSSAATFSGG